MPSSSEKNTSPTYSNEEGKPICDPTDANYILMEELKIKCRNQAEQIIAWKKHYAVQNEQHFREQREKTEQLNYLTSQLLLLESRLIKKQKQIANILYQREITIYRQQKIIEALSSRLVDHGIDSTLIDGTNTDFDSLNDSDSAVVLEDIDSDCNSSIVQKRKNGNDVTVMRSISDAIETNLKYTNNRRTNCYLRRPDILETVYSVEEDPPEQVNDPTQSADVSEKRDKFKNRSDKRISDENSSGESNQQKEQHPHDQQSQSIWAKLTNYHYYSMKSDSSKYMDHLRSSTPNPRPPDEEPKQQTQVTNFNRVMSNHRSVTKVKDVKYKRINKAKSKSLEELRGRLKHWVERGVSSNNLQQCQHQHKQMEQRLEANSGQTPQIV